MTYSIYTLSCPETNTVFYVGSTRYGLHDRLRAHTNEVNRHDYPVYKYMSTLSGRPVIDEIEEIEVESRNEAELIESYWIDQFRQWGFILYNQVNNLRVPKVGVKTTISVSQKTVDAIKLLIVCTDVSIGGYFEQAVKEKIERDKLNKA